MKTFNQSLANLYFRKRAISRDTALAVTSFPEELTDIIQRREGGQDRRRRHGGCGPPLGRAAKGEVNDGHLCLERQEPLRRQRSGASASPRPRRI